MPVCRPCTAAGPAGPAAPIAGGDLLLGLDHSTHVTAGGPHALIAIGLHPLLWRPLQVEGHQAPHGAADLFLLLDNAETAAEQLGLLFPWQRQRLQRWRRQWRPWPQWRPLLQQQ